MGKEKPEEEEDDVFAMLKNINAEVTWMNDKVVMGIFQRQEDATATLKKFRNNSEAPFKLRRWFSHRPKAEIPVTTALPKQKAENPPARPELPKEIIVKEDESTTRPTEVVVASVEQTEKVESSVTEPILKR